MQDALRAMIRCDNCAKYYHMDCMDLKEDQSYDDVEWKCHECHVMLDKLKS